MQDIVIKLIIIENSIYFTNCIFFNIANEQLPVVIKHNIYAKLD